MEIVKQVIITLLSVLVLGACVSTTGAFTAVEPSIQKKIGADMFSELHNDFVPSKMLLKIKNRNQAERAFSDLALSNGFAVSSESGESVVINYYYDLDSNTYIGTLLVGEYRRYTKRYKNGEGGLNQFGLTTVGEY